MNFLKNFRSYFTPEERESELYKILAMQGVNAEKAILEELNAEIRRSTEATVFTEQKLRSWLAFFLKPVRNVVSATGVGSIVVNAYRNSPGGLTNAVVPAGSIVTSTHGKTYQIQENIALSGVGSSVSFTFIQGETSSVTREYQEFVAIPIGTGNVDLSYTRVFLGGLEVPLVSPYSVFPDELRNSIDRLNNTLAGITSSISVNQLNNIFNSSIQAMWNAVQSVSVKPSAGFFPFFFNNTLFIKIYTGVIPGTSTLIPSPEGQSITVEYRLSDGALGNIGENNLDQFSSAITTLDGGTVEYTLYNLPAQNGVNPPSKAELVNALRHRFFASTHVSSIPEYTAWFLSQPGIGDCLVLSDYRKWILSRKEEVSGFDLKGAVDIYLLDEFGNIITARSPFGFYTSFIRELDARLDPVRDIAFLEYLTPNVYWHYYVIHYRSSVNETIFFEAAARVISHVYSLEWTHSVNSSLFNDLDRDDITKAIREGSDSVGLRVIPYHYYEYVYIPEHGADIWRRFRHYQDEQPGGWYEYWEFDDPFNPSKLGFFQGDTFYEGSPVAIFKEFEDISGSVSIYQHRKVPRYLNGEPSGWDWTNLVYNVSASRRGTRSGGEVSISLSGFRPGVLRCFWALENEGVVSVGGDPVNDVGIRKLPVKAVNLGNVSTSETYFGGYVHFEKYI